MNRIIVRVIAMVPAVSVTVAINAAAQYEITRSVFGGGAGTGADTAFQLSGTVGQGAAGPCSGETGAALIGFWGIGATVATGAGRPSDAVPGRFALFQNCPNPFNPLTQIRYAVPRESRVTIELFNVLGQRVATLEDGVKRPGFHTIDFDASGLASGVYVYRMTAQGYVSTRKLVVLK